MREWNGLVQRSSLPRARLVALLARVPAVGYGNAAGGLRNVFKGGPAETMPSLIEAYLPLVIFAGLGAVFMGVLLAAPFVVAFKSPEPEKLSAYECSFNAFDEARMKFDIRF